MSRILGKDDLLSGDLLKRELVTVPGFDASIWLREMSGEHVIEFKKYIDELKADGASDTTLEQDVEIMTMVISFSACDENGVLLFTQEDAKSLARNNLNLLMDLGNRALEISGVQVGAKGMSSEVADNLPNAPAKSSSVNLPRSSRKRGRKS